MNVSKVKEPIQTKDTISSKDKTEIVMESKIETANQVEGNIFDNLDFTNFCVRSHHSGHAYRDEVPLTDGTIEPIERKLGYKLPQAYIDLSRNHQNGELLKRRRMNLDQPPPYNYVYITEIFGIGNSKGYPLGGRLGSAFWMKEWHYPNIGIYFADTSAAGQEMFCLEYRNCGPEGEPEVVKVHEESNYRIQPVRKTSNPSFEVSYIVK